MEDEFKAQLEKALLRAGMNMKQASLAAGLNETFVRDILKRDKTPSITALSAIAKGLGMTLNELLQGADPVEHTVPVVGYVGAAAEVYPIDDHAKGDGLDRVAAPYDANGDTVAVIVKGDSMSPMAEDGWLLFYNKRGSAPESPDSKRPYVVWTEDGRALVKRLKKGSRQGHYHLFSINPAYDPEPDVLIGYAALVTEIRPR
jgi:SOS-response transcriptional repressor LexA